MQFRKGETRFTIRSGIRRLTIYDLRFTRICTLQSTPGAGQTGPNNVLGKLQSHADHLGSGSSGSAQSSGRRRISNISSSHQIAMKKRIFSFLLVAAVAQTMIACSGGSVDYSKAAPQTGGPEQGEWRDTQGTKLSMNSGNFTYQKAGGSEVHGTYTVSGSSITLAGGEGTNITASWPNQNGPLTIDGENLTKTD